jgi:hypothetical protein
MCIRKSGCCPRCYVYNSRLCVLLFHYESEGIFRGISGVFIVKVIIKMSSIGSLEKKRNGIRVLMTDDEEVKLNIPEKPPTF